MFQDKKVIHLVARGKNGEVIQSMLAQVIYNGELKDVLEVDLNLVFGE